MDFNDIKDSFIKVDALNMNYFYKCFLLNYEIGDELITDIFSNKFTSEDINNLIFKNKFNKKYYNFKKKNNILFEVTKGLEKDGEIGLNTLLEIYSKYTTEQERKIVLRKLSSFYSNIMKLGYKDVNIGDAQSEINLKLQLLERYHTDGILKKSEFIRDKEEIINGLNLEYCNPTFLIHRKSSKESLEKSTEVYLFGTEPNAKLVPDSSDIFKRMSKKVRRLHEQEQLNAFNSIFDIINSESKIITKQMSNLKLISNKLDVNDLMFDSLDDIDITELLDKEQLNIIKRLIIGNNNLKRIDNITETKKRKILSFDKKTIK